MTELAYLAAGVLFILGLKGLTSPRTARRGNRLAAAGMLVAAVTVVIDLVDLDAELKWAIVIGGVVVGGAIGALLALRVQMTDMPQLVAAFNGFGGGASALVSAAAIVATASTMATETALTTALSLVIGTVTFTGSFVAFGKLQGIVTGRPIAMPGGTTGSTASIIHHRVHRIHHPPPGPPHPSSTTGSTASIIHHRVHRIHHPPPGPPHPSSTTGSTASIIHHRVHRIHHPPPGPPHPSSTSR